MYRKTLIGSVGVLLFFSLQIPDRASAQLSVSGQLRTRTELRNGYGNLVLKGSDPAFFTSQRTRLNVGFRWSRLSFGVALQDVRVWGQDASSISNADGNKLMLHEGWADLVLLNKEDTSLHFKFLDFVSLKVGRQELSYDDVRLLGNLDWLQQARRHDMVLLKTVHKGYQVDVGLAYNQNGDAIGITNTSYLPANIPAYVKTNSGVLVPTPQGIIPLANGGSATLNSSKSGTPVLLNPPNTNGGNQDYKSFASVYVSRKFASTKLSALFFNDNFGGYRIDSIGNETTGYVYGRRFVTAGASDKFDYSKTNHRFTYGLMINHSIGASPSNGVIALQAAYYRQSGKNRDGITMSDGFHYTVSATIQKNKFSVTPGYDVLSGNDAATASDEKFDPLYGTPHKHWGYMDYFYVGTGSPTGGLQNPYLKLKYTNQRFSAGIDLHHFLLHTSMKKDDGAFIKKHLGNEVDLLLNYGLNKFTNIELGYSMMLASASMPLAKSQATSDVDAAAFRRTGNWFYVMLRFSPDFSITNSNAVKR